MFYVLLNNWLYVCISFRLYPGMNTAVQLYIKAITFVTNEYYPNILLRTDDVLKI